MILGLGNISDLTLGISNNQISPVNCVKLLGIQREKDLKFNTHILLLSDICKKSSRQINSLKRKVK